MMRVVGAHSPRPPLPRPPFSVAALAERIARISPTPLAEVLPPETVRRLAAEELTRRGVVLRGHASLKTLALDGEVARHHAALARFHASADAITGHGRRGRPRQHGALRDLIIMAACLNFRCMLGTPPRHRLKVARRATAELFGLTSDTKTTKRRTPSIDQVRRAEERTNERLIALSGMQGGRVGIAELFDHYYWATIIVTAYMLTNEQEPDGDMRLHTLQVASFAFMLDFAMDTLSPELRQLIPLARARCKAA